MLNRFTSKARVSISISVSIFMAALNWYSFPVILPVLYKEWFLTSTEAGLIMAAPLIGQVLSLLFTGYLSDVFGGRRVFSVFSAITGLFSCLFAFTAQDFVSAVALRILAGIGFGGLYIPGIKIIASFFPREERGSAIGFYTSFLLASNVCSYYVSGPLTVAGGWRRVVLWTSIWAFPASLISYLFIGEERRDMKNENRFKMESLFLSPVFWLVNLSYIGHMLELYGLRNWIAPYIYSCALEAGYKEEEALNLSSAVGGSSILMGVFSSTIGGRLSDKLGRYRSIALTSATSASFSFLFGWLIGQPLWILSITALLYGFLVSADTAIFKAALTDVAPLGSLGKILSFQALLGISSASVSTSLFGYILDITNETGIHGYIHVWGWAYMSLGFLAIISPLCALVADRKPGKKLITYF